MGITLRCTDGPGRGELIEVEAELILGRDQPEPGGLKGDLRLSRRHARVFLDDGVRAVVEDLGSTNGTWVNDERLTETRVLASGDRLRVGQTTFEVELPPVAAATQVDTHPPVRAQTVAETPPPVPHLRVVAGPMEGTEILLADELLIGRSFDEPGDLGGDGLLSRRHARIARGPGGVFFLEDSGSTNGTRLNRVRVRHAQSLKDGDVIELGSSRLEVLGVPRVPLDAERPPEPSTPAAGPLEPRPGEAARVSERAAAPGEFAPRGAAKARLSSRRGLVIGVFASIFVVAGAVAVGAVLLAAPLTSQPCPRGFICHGPPTAPPLRVLRTYRGPLGWRVEFDPQQATVASTGAGGNQLILEESGGIDRELGLSPGAKAIGIVIRAYPASQLSAPAAMAKLAAALDSQLIGTTTAPASDQMFSNPVLGLHPGYGEVLEGNARTPQGPGGLFKVAVIAASAGRVTIAAGVIYRIRLGTSQGSDPDTLFDQFGDQILETVRFPSDGMY